MAIVAEVAAKAAAVSADTTRWRARWLSVQVHVQPLVWFAVAQ